MSNIKIITPNPGFQERFVSSNVDIVIGGGILGGGKSTGAILMCAEAVLDPNFKGLMLRNNAVNLKAGGGLVDEMQSFFGGICDVRVSQNPSAVFPSGARVDFNHTSDQNYEVLLEKVKGWQYDMIYFDELTGFEWLTFVTLMSRNRGSGKWTGKIRGTCNPKKSHWLRKYLDWYIGADGYIIPERDGVVRYVYQTGETVDDLVWGSSKREVYEQCKNAIDKSLAKQNSDGGHVVWHDLILSSVFYKGSLSENKAVLGRDRGYVGKIGMMGRNRAQANLEGNWNIDPDMDQNIPIPPDVARKVFLNDSMSNSEKWITVDVAEEGTNNTLILVWYGFEVVDFLVISKAKPKENADNTLIMAEKHRIGNDHIIYDATRATYMNDYIREAIPFLSGTKPVGMYARGANRLKDEVFLRLVYMLNNNSITITEDVANRRYPLVNPNTGVVSYVSFQSEFIEECNVVQFDTTPSGKKRLISKKEMKRLLGRGRSTDVLDAVAMRMLPVLKIEHGREMEFSLANYERYTDYTAGNNIETIYTALSD